MRLIAASTPGAPAADPASTTTRPSSPTCTPTFAPAPAITKNEGRTSRISRPPDGAAACAAAAFSGARPRPGRRTSTAQTANTAAARALGRDAGNVIIIISRAITASTLAWRRVYLNPRHVGASGSTVSAAGHEIDVTDLVHAAQVRVVHFQLYDDSLRIELEPTLIVERHLGHHEIAGERVRPQHPALWTLECLAADEQFAVGELHDRMQHVQILRARSP